MPEIKAGGYQIRGTQRPGRLSATNCASIRIRNSPAAAMISVVNLLAKSFAAMTLEAVWL
jgi:hypothetical protein